MATRTHTEWPVAEQFEHAGIACLIVYDETPGNPYREFDEVGSLLVSPSLAREYDLGETFVRMEEFSSLRAAQRYLTLCEGYAVAIPFRWVNYGSGQERAYLTDTDDDRAAGFVVGTLERGRELISDDATVDDVERVIRAEFEGEFRAYVEGSVYGYVVAPDEPDEDSCWGYYENPDKEPEYVREEARAAAEWIADKRRKRRAAAVMGWALAHAER